MSSDIRAEFVLQRPGFRLTVAPMTLPGHGFTALFGPSGSGKTTLLRCFAGLERAAQGRLLVGDEIWQDDTQLLPPHRRQVGYVFQGAELFPHLSAEQNILYGRRRLSPQASPIALDEVVTALGLARLLSRRTAHLSGGERQRIAIARALLRNPKLLLMDEPLAALDAEAKSEILPYLEKLHVELDMPVIYVTHAAREVERLADHVIYMRDGTTRPPVPLAAALRETDSPLFRDKGAFSFFEMRIEPDVHPDLARLTNGHLALRCPKRSFPNPRTRVKIYARDVSLSLTADDQTSILNVLSAEICELIPLPDSQVRVRLIVGGRDNLLADLTRFSVSQLGLRPGSTVFAQIKAVSLVT